MNKNISSFDEVMSLARTYLTKKESLDLIQKAYDFANQKHAGQFRKSGEPYVSHLYNVAYILAGLQAGPQTIAAGLLHDTIEDCNVSFDDIKELFDEEIATLVKGVTKLGKLSASNREDFEAENHRKIFIAMAKDIRVIIIKLADRLHNMRTLDGHKNDEKQKIIANETLKVYVPIAHRLGINTVKSELEDLSLKYLEPEKYQHVKSLLAKKEAERKATLDAMSKKILDLLDQYDIPHTLSGRVKSIYGIYKKMYIANRMFEEIYDLQALRIITETITNCYEILGYIHANYRPIPGRFKDYIAMPKPNLYQSLHTTIVADDGNIFEIQIRTKEMDEIAETGIAAHWRYKENTEYSSKAEQKEIEEKLHWFRELVSMSDDQASLDAKEYMESLQKDIFEANVYVLTPKGRVIDLPKGSTPLDFAYRIHTQVGHSTIGATVNGMLVPLSTQLKTGDVVDIKTTKNPNPLPNEDWLKFVKTNNAKNAIKKAISKYNNEQRRDEIIASARESLEQVVRADKDYDWKDVIKRIDDKKFLSLYKVETIEDLYLLIANKHTNATNVFSKLKAEDKKKEQVVPFTRQRKNVSNNGVIVPGIDSVAISFSQCCSPIPGDDIVGYISKGKGIKVHRKDCPNIKGTINRMIDLYWDYEFFEEHPTPHYVDIQVSGHDRPTLLSDVINQLMMLKVSITSVNITKNPTTLVAILSLCIQVNDKDHLNLICNTLKSTISGIYDVERYSKN